MKARKARRSTSPRPRSLERIAIHEAGHAVAVVLYKMGSHRRGATIVQDGETLGQVFHRRHPASFQQDLSSGRNVEKRIRRTVCVLLAGYAAEKLEFGARIKPIGADQDFHDAVGFVESMSCSTEEVNAWLQLLSIQIENKLRLEHHRRAVRLVADELLSKRQINYSTIRRLVKQALSSE